MRGLSVLLPHDPDGGARDRLASWAERYWRSHLPEAEVLVGGLGRGSRSGNRNHLARQAQGQVLAIFDADVIAAPEDVLALAVRCLHSGMVGKFRYHGWLGQEPTEALLAANPDNAAVPAPESMAHTAIGHPGLAFFATREAYETCGGFGEEFIGWGGEDTAFMCVASTLTGITWLPAWAVHLWHPHPKGTGKTDKHAPEYLRNRHLCCAYGRAVGDPAAMRAVIEARAERCQ